MYQWNGCYIVPRKKCNVVASFPILPYSYIHCENGHHIIEKLNVSQYILECS